MRRLKDISRLAHTIASLAQSLASLRPVWQPASCDPATAKINSPEFKQRMADIQKQIDSGAMQRRMEQASKQLKAAEDRLRQQQMRQEQTK